MHVDIRQPDVIRPQLKTPDEIMLRSVLSEAYTVTALAAAEIMVLMLRRELCAQVTGGDRGRESASAG